MGNYKELTIEEAEALFDVGVKEVEFETSVDTWRLWCSKGRVGDRGKYFSPLEMVDLYPEVRYRIEVE